VLAEFSRTRCQTTVDEGQRARCQDMGQIRRGSRSMTVGLTDREDRVKFYIVFWKIKSVINHRDKRKYGSNIFVQKARTPTLHGT